MRKWYLQPETFIALAALVVSVSAVVVGIYEAALQRRHDRAEVWPNLEVQTWIDDKGARVTLENTGVGPAIVVSAMATVDGQARHGWLDVIRALTDSTHAYEITTVVGHSLRAGESATLIGLPTAALHTPFYPWIGRVKVRMCYRSIFDDYWEVDAQLGVGGHALKVKGCAAQPDSTDF